VASAAIAFEGKGHGVLGRRIAECEPQVFELDVGVILFSVVEEKLESGANFADNEVCAIERRRRRALNQHEILGVRGSHGELKLADFAGELARDASGCRDAGEARSGVPLGVGFWIPVVREHRCDVDRFAERDMG